MFQVHELKWCQERIFHPSLENRDTTRHQLVQPFDIGSNTITKLLAEFLKMYHKCLHVDGIALFWGNWAFAVELEGKMVNQKVEEIYELFTHARNLWLHLKEMH